MPNPERPIRSRQEVERAVPNPREQYQSLLKMANDKVATNPFVNDVKLVAGLEKERDERLLRAARYIADLVGNVPTIKLSEAVAPETLKEVLQRAGVHYSKLKMVGEGREDLGALIEQRDREMARMEGRVKEFTDPSIQSILGRMWQKAKDAEAKLLPLEAKDVWTKLDAISYASLESVFLDTLANVADACNNYEKQVKKLE